MFFCCSLSRIQADEIASILSAANSAGESLKAILKNLEKSSLKSMDIGLENLLIQDSAAFELEVDIALH